MKYYKKYIIIILQAQIHIPNGQDNEITYFLIYVLFFYLYPV